MPETLEKMFSIGQIYLKRKPHTYARARAHIHEHRITCSLLQLTLALNISQIKHMRLLWQTSKHRRERDFMN